MVKIRMKLSQSATGFVRSVSPNQRGRTPPQNARAGEVQELRTWFHMGTERTSRTTFGVSQLGIEQLGGMLVELSDSSIPDSWVDGVDLGGAVRLPVEDIKAFYQEAATAQPGSAYASSTELADWFFHETEAGKQVLKAREVCRASDIGDLRYKSMVFTPPHYHGKGLDYS